MTLFKLNFEELFPKVLCPLSTVGKNKWVTKGLKKSSETLKCLSSIKNSQTDPSFSHFYKRYRKTYRKLLLAAKRTHNSKLVLSAENKNKAVWTIVKQENESVKLEKSKRMGL